MTTDVTIATTDGNVQIKALAALGGLVVHENINLEDNDVWPYALSHMASGRHIAAFRSRGEAAAAMQAIAALLPWAGPEQAVRAQEATRQRCKAWGLIRKFGGYRGDGGRAMCERAVDA